jgi:membrane-bound lytic murein transglycosylase D
LLSALATSPATAGPQQPGAGGKIGPIHVSEAGRTRVRGDRPEGTSVEVAWRFGKNDRGRGDREALAAFERATFPPVGPQAKASKPPQTIIERPPEPWMARLDTPAISVRWNRKTVEYLRYFRDTPRGQKMVRSWFRRLGRYEKRLRMILREVSVPEDLVFVAMAESGFDPRVRSRVGAGGMWQFMDATGRVYGLEQDYWVDERFDIEKSTYAAALYLKDLRTRFGSWELALAAYNAGYGIVMASIRRHNTNNFWTLAAMESGLPYASTNYVPKIVAGAIVGRNRRVFGCDTKTLQPAPPIDWVEVLVSQSTALSAVATAIGEDPELILELNAQLIRGRTPPRPGGYRIRIPPDRLEGWKNAHGSLPETTYTVRHGDKLAKIAERFGTTDRKLRKLNGIRDSAELEGGLTIVVPAGKPGKGKPSRGKKAAKRVAALPQVSPSPGHKVVFFETTRASTPGSVARAFAADWKDIVAWNDLDPQARLQAGQLLQVVVPEGFDPDAAGVVALGADEVRQVVRGSREHLEAGLAERGLVRRGYKVHRGDTLKKISKRFRLSLGDLARINGFSRKHKPKAGDIVVVYVPKGRTRGTRKAPDPPAVYPSANAGGAGGASAGTKTGEPGSEGKQPKRSKKKRRRRKPSTATSSRLPRRREAPAEK